MTPYKFVYTISGTSQKFPLTKTDYAITKQEVIDDIKYICEAYGTDNNSIHYLDGTINVMLERSSPVFLTGITSVNGKAIPLQQSMCRMDQLKEGDVFSFVGERTLKLRPVQQVGKIELYAPAIGTNTMGHSKDGGEDVYLRSTTSVFLYTEKKIL